MNGGLRCAGAALILVVGVGACSIARDEADEQPAVALPTPTTNGEVGIGQAAIAQSDRFELTVDGTAFGTNVLGDETVCVQATITNPTAYDVMPIGFFSLALPIGRIEAVPAIGSNLFPAVASVGSAPGTLCFLSYGERGQAELRYASPVTTKAWPIVIG